MASYNVSSNITGESNLLGSVLLRRINLRTVMKGAMLTVLVLMLKEARVAHSWL